MARLQAPHSKNSILRTGCIAERARRRGVRRLLTIAMTNVCMTQPPACVEGACLRAATAPQRTATPPHAPRVWDRLCKHIVSSRA